MAPIEESVEREDMDYLHMRNFLDCVKSRKTPNAPLEEGHRSTSMSLLANIAMETRSRLEWDGAREEYPQSNLGQREVALCLPGALVVGIDPRDFRCQAIGAGDDDGVPTPPGDRQRAFGQRRGNGPSGHRVSALFFECLAHAEIEKQKLRVWFSWLLEEMPGRLAAMAKFEEHNPDIEVEVTRIAGDPHFNPQNQKLMCAIAGGDPPGGGAAGPIHHRKLGGERRLSGVSTISSRRTGKRVIPSAVTAGHYYEACWKEAVFEGKVYAVPTSTDSRVMYYHTDLLASAAGTSRLAVVRRERRSTRLRSPGRRCNPTISFSFGATSEGNLAQVGYLPDQGNCFLYMYGFQNGGQFMDMEEHRCTLNDPRDRRTLSTICAESTRTTPQAERIESRDGNKRRGSRRPFREESTNPSSRDRLAFWVDTEGFMSIISSYKPNLSFGVIPVPYPEDKKPITWSGGWSLVIPKGVPDEKAQLAWRFIRWMTSPEANLFMTRYQRDYNRSKGKPVGSQHERQPDRQRGGAQSSDSSPTPIWGQRSKRASSPLSTCSPFPSFVR